MLSREGTPGGSVFETLTQAYARPPSADLIGVPQPQCTVTVGLTDPSEFWESF